LPPHEAFYRFLKKENISQEAYALCQTIWKDKNWTSIRDHLEYNNNLDVEPFLQAVEKLFHANKELGLDAFKSSLTLPGLNLQLMFSDLPPGVFFTLINQSNSDLHRLIKKNVCGGLSVVFHREHQVDVEQILNDVYDTEVSVVAPFGEQICHTLVSFIYYIIQNQQGAFYSVKVFSLGKPFNEFQVWNGIKATLPLAVTPNDSLWRSCHHLLHMLNTFRHKLGFSAAGWSCNNARERVLETLVQLSLC